MCYPASAISRPIRAVRSLRRKNKSSTKYGGIVTIVLVVLPGPYLFSARSVEGREGNTSCMKTNRVVFLSRLSIFCVDLAARIKSK